MSTNETSNSKRRTADDHVAVIKRWQAETGNVGAPPREYDTKTSAYIQWRRREATTPAAVAFEAAVAPLGISLGPGPTSAHRAGKVDLSKPRGILQCMSASRDWLVQGRFPSLFSESLDERHLAGWCIRMQAGLVSKRHIPLTPNAPTALKLVAFVRDLNELQPPTAFALEWHAFTERLRTQFARGTKGAAWCDYMCQRKDAFIDEATFQADSAALRRGSGPRPSLPHPLAVIEAINRILGSLPQRVTFAPRPMTVDAAHRLISAGIELHHHFPQEP
jgi:hypothetical protein